MCDVCMCMMCIASNGMRMTSYNTQMDVSLTLRGRKNQIKLSVCNVDDDDWNKTVENVRETVGDCKLNNWIPHMNSSVPRCALARITRVTVQIYICQQHSCESIKLLCTSCISLDGNAIFFQLIHSSFVTRHTQLFVCAGLVRSSSCLWLSIVKLTDWLSAWTFGTARTTIELKRKKGISFSNDSCVSSSSRSSATTRCQTWNWRKVEIPAQLQHNHQFVCVFNHFSFSVLILHNLAKENM